MAQTVKAQSFSTFRDAATETKSPPPPDLRNRATTEDVAPRPPREHREREPLDHPAARDIARKQREAIVITDSPIRQRTATRPISESRESRDREIREMQEVHNVREARAAQDPRETPQAQQSKKRKLAAPVHNAENTRFPHLPSVPSFALAPPAPPPPRPQPDALSLAIASYRTSQSRRAVDMTIALKHRSESQEMIGTHDRWSQFSRGPEVAKLDLLRTLDRSIAADREILRILTQELKDTLAARELVGSLVDADVEERVEKLTTGPKRIIGRPKKKWSFWAFLGKVIMILALLSAAWVAREWNII
ncbi:hypothetical protein BZA77DRAFT_318168 [Pyronema omphalodes]|nr:hypothetical protein BZA77DRAFT_318168 [Pyronema omphalodes]